MDLQMENNSAVKEETKEEYISSQMERKLIGLLPMFILVLIIVLRISWTLYKSFVCKMEFSPIALAVVIMGCIFLGVMLYLNSYGQKTRNPQQRRMYAGTRPRPSLNTHEPTIYVSPSNLPPPPKYECMAPPSYEEVVGVHYPNLQAGQPITQPIETALAQSAQSNTANSSRTNDSVPRIGDTGPALATPNTTVPTLDDSVTRPNNDTIVVTVNERQNS